MSRQRFIDVEFDHRGYSIKQILGRVTCGSDGIYVLRVSIPYSLVKANMTVSFERPDKERGSGLMLRNYDDDKTIYTYTLTEWALAIKGDLRISFSLIYSDPLSEEYSEIIANDPATQEVAVIYPHEYMRLATLVVEESILQGELIRPSSDLTGAILEDLSGLHDDIAEIKSDVARIDGKDAEQDSKITYLEDNPTSLDMGLW